MAQKSKKKVSKIKVKKKVWYKVIAPKIFGNKEIGESYLQAPENSIGRKLTANLKDLTGNVKDQNVHIGLQINKVDGSTLRTSIVSYKLSSQYVKRCVRKNCNKLDHYFTSKTKGGKNVIVKCLMVTVGKTQSSTRTSLRHELQKNLEESITKSDFATFISGLVSRRTQMDLKKKLKKIYPVKEVSVRMLKLNEKGIATEETTVEDKTKKPEVKEAPKEVPKEVTKEAKEEAKETLKETPKETKEE
ncbi:hypothetical protein HOE37_00550 [Candidatus Woesearchaeota archaeon]|jgi:small subunit ribosomal protein S3Ae|nr:hypothetical protein [Candidatus Woesearchaeota archaeon]MBT4110325.1 hypothetical protein [Candidatus Woesearchaeota archaeon]MBT4336151.1 hypothetical protein [Candidatus Woesearchaeota archaeon]MBT4468870.1 hypothetical protein [Candidatus Woesearchaeota archaeon]MBT6744811.1 hypothetical protein [Candidatus Woesearchaeota archaeon]